MGTTLHHLHTEAALPPAGYKAPTRWVSCPQPPTYSKQSPVSAREADVESAPLACQERPSSYAQDRKP